MKLPDIAALKTARVEGEPGPLNFGNHADICDHLARLRPEFGGQPELCFFNATLIVYIRRSIDLVENVPAFLGLWAEEAEFLTSHLDARWLMSSCDTFCDHGSDRQREAALAISAMFHTMQLAETERLILRDPRLDPARYARLVETHRARRHVELWGRVKAYALEDGDVSRFTLERIVRAAVHDRALCMIARTLTERSLASDTLFGRLAPFNPDFLPPDLSGARLPVLPPILVGSKDGFNVVRVEGRYLVVPQALGPLDLQASEARGLPGIVAVSSILEALDEISRSASAGDVPAEPAGDHPPGSCAT
jgi:hypothetical protein